MAERAVEIIEALILRDVRMGSGGPRADVLLAGGRVAAITNDRQAAGGIREVDGQGGTVLPGLVDAHVHAVQWAAARRRISVAAARSAVEAVTLLVERSRALPAQSEELLAAVGFRDGLWADRPHKDLLERALPGRAVALFSNDLHTLWLSPAALALVGVQHPTGVLVEEQCMRTTAALPVASVETEDRWVAEAMAAAAARGVTGIVDYEFADTVTDWTRRAGQAAPAVRVSCVIARFVLDQAIARGLRTGDVLPGSGGLLTVGPYKLFVDGSLNTRTAYCHEPYPDGHTRGNLELTPSVLAELMKLASANGISPAVHAIGDRANTIALDAFAEVGCGGRIEHAQLLRHSELGRFKELGVIAGVQPAHAPADRDVADRYWAGRTARAFPYADLLAAGATLEIGSDAPVSPLDPWDGIAAAVTRTDDDRSAWHPEQAIPLADALRAASKGRDAVRVGDVADLMVVATDPASVSPRELQAMPVVATVLAGRLTHLAT
jgi:predicted amidohydrolase YtcJ